MDRGRGVWKEIALTVERITKQMAIFWLAIASVVIFMGVAVSIRAQAAEITQTPQSYDTNPAIQRMMRRVTPEQRKAAAIRAAETRSAAARQDNTINALAAPTPGGTPVYFGIYPNYANSPLPRGPVTAITVIEFGTGYSATPVITISDAYGTGTGATAAATVTAGVITAITVTAGGSN